MIEKLQAHYPLTELLEEFSHFRDRFGVVRLRSLLMIGDGDGQ
jgi:hypothetical protein